MYVKTKKENYLQCGSVQLKLLFWFSSNTNVMVLLGLLGDVHKDNIYLEFKGV